MADCQECAPPSLNSCVPHLHNLSLELKCFSCLDFYKEPVLLPCSHLVCSSCLPDLASPTFECPLCKYPYEIPGVRRIYFLDNIVDLYKNINSTFSAHMLKLGRTDQGRPLEKISTSNLKASVPFSNSQEASQQPYTPSTTGVKRSLVACGYRSHSSPDSEGNATTPSMSNGFREKDCFQSAHSNPVTYTKKRSADSFVASRGNFLSAHTADDHPSGNRSKKQKKQSPDVPKKAEVPRPQTLSDSKNDPVIDEPLVSNSSQPTSTNEHLTGSNKFICGFCQTSKVTEITGPMFHYANKKLVFDEEAARPKVVHAHMKCIEWAPRIYHTDGTIQNLNSELSRGSKLKCSKCQLKGAPLGCYLEDCRKTFHYPCAAEMQDCRWDDDNYLMYCPRHASLKFPKEKTEELDEEKSRTHACCNAAQKEIRERIS